MLNVTLENNKALVKQVKEDGSVRIRTLSLEAFIHYISSLKSTTEEDTGWFTNHLIRKRESPSLLSYFFFYEKIPCHFRLADIDTTFDIPNVLFKVDYNKIQKNAEYRIFFCYCDSLLGAFSLEDALIIPNFFPNAFLTKICWGDHATEGQIIEACQRRDTAYLSRIPARYFNSPFNLDLTPHSIEFYRALPEEFAKGTIYTKLKNKGRVYEL